MAKKHGYKKSEYFEKQYFLPCSVIFPTCSCHASYMCLWLPLVMKRCYYNTYTHNPL